MTPQPPNQPPETPPDPQAQAAPPQAPNPDLDHEVQTPPPTKPAARQKFIQLELSETELGRLKSRIENDFLSARSNHDRRIEKFRRIYRMWRGLNETRGQKDDGNDFQIPLLKWVTFGQWAKIMQSLLGEDAEITAKAQTPVDEQDAVKAGKYMTWRFFEYMQATIALATFVFRSVIFGRGHAEIIYEQEFYWERGEDGTDTEVLAYDGPRLRPLWPSQLILPAQDDVTNVDEYEWKIRRSRITPQMLVEGERREKYQGIEDNWDQIMAAASQRQERDYWWDDERIDADEAEGVDHATILGNRDSLEMWTWYGKWRLPKGKRDSKPNNIKFRSVDESEIVVKYLPKVGIIIGVQDLRDLYPRMRKRSPFVDMGLIKDGSYWPPGLGELVEDLQTEGTINHALFRKAGMFSVGPIIFYKPSSGFDPDTFTYEPGMAIPSEDPAGVKTIELKADLSYCEQMSHTIQSIAERVTGVTDQSLGKTSDEPNAPRTASGQAMLINEGNVRAALDMNMVREDLSRVLGYIWLLDREYADEKVFFRVTGDDAGAMFDVRSGFGTMTAEDREHQFGFDVKFATSVYSREARKANLLQIYQISMQNPVVQTNPRALWTILNRVWEAFGEKNFASIIPEPPELDEPKSPKIEWAMMLNGDEPVVNPADDDVAHIKDHRARLQDEINKEKDRVDLRLVKEARDHIIQHERQLMKKQAIQRMAQAAAALMQPQSGQPLQAFPAPPPPAAAPAIAPPAAGAPAPQPPGPSGPVTPNPA